MKTSDRQILQKKSTMDVNERSFHINEKGGIWKCRRKKKQSIMDWGKRDLLLDEFQRLNATGSFGVSVGNFHEAGEFAVSGNICITIHISHVLYEG